MLVATALLIIGLVLLVYGADPLMFSAAILCCSLGIPPLIISMMLVGIGTSLPELIVSFSVATHGQMDIAVGTAMGSNITNILLIPGVAALLHPLTIHSRLVRSKLPLMLLVTLLCGVMLFDNELSRNDGLAMITIAAIYLMFIIKIARRAERENSNSLTREQLAELPRDDVGNKYCGLLVAGSGADCAADVNTYGHRQRHGDCRLFRRQRTGDWPDDYFGQHQPAGTGYGDCWRAEGRR
ncbi:inner membrane protein YrbG [Candidatus Erwinia dacicola]|uniref:Inner membrane protein YrbG n=1 Tax=Candidatus Erwinia dacicola TaxID=252393 RepID=A0A328TSU0_9GAMM|nr:inner membrane protein YrbG [Candidatus Erwinia dacicola]